MRGMEEGTCQAVLPSFHIGSTANEITGLSVIRRPHARKKNQRVMNGQLSTSISGKDYPENARGARRPSSAFCSLQPFVLAPPVVTVHAETAPHDYGLNGKIADKRREGHSP